MNTENNAVAPLYRTFALQFCYVASGNDPEGNLSKQMPGWQMVWSSGQPGDPNYFFVAKPTSAVAGDFYVLAIRGSVMPADNWDTFVDYILEDLNDLPLPWNYGGTGATVGAGSELAFQELKNAKNAVKGAAPETLLEFLTNNAVGDRKKLIITGHSLGGNLAKVYASYFMAMLKVAPQGNINLVTFAAPASGNTAFQNDLNKKITAQEHCKNLNDIVPNYPTVSGLQYIGSLYKPGPSAAKIDITYKDKKTGETKETTLQAFFGKLSNDFAIFDYQQPDPAYYTLLPSPLIGNKLDDTITNWLGQAAAQHQIAVYAKLLEIVLPLTGTQVPAAKATV